MLSSGVLYCSNADIKITKRYKTYSQPCARRSIDVYIIIILYCLTIFYYTEAF